PPRSTPTPTRLPYTTLFRSRQPLKDIKPAIKDMPGGLEMFFHRGLRTAPPGVFQTQKPFNVAVHQLLFFGPRRQEERQERTRAEMMLPENQGFVLGRPRLPVRKINRSLLRHHPGFQTLHHGRKRNSV